MTVELKTIRKWYTTKSSEGEMFLDGEHECWSIEDPSRKLASSMPLSDILRDKIAGETAIPTGRYKLELYNSPKHGPDTLQLVGVPGFTNIQIHAANSPTELLGCIAPGLDRTKTDDNWVGRSGAALKVLRDKVIPRMRAGEDAYITVEEERAA